MEPDVLRNDGHFRADVDLIIFMALPRTATGDAALQRIDQTLRAHLMEAGEPWCVIYGATLAEQVAQARAAIDRLEPTSQPMRPRWQHPCENCSDPACEQKLLSDLLAQRTKRSVG